MLLAGLPTMVGSRDNCSLYVPEATLNTIGEDTPPQFKAATAEVNDVKLFDPLPAGLMVYIPLRKTQVGPSIVVSFDWRLSINPFGADV